jgi:hypothetical protein
MKEVRMDPNVALAQIRELVEALQQEPDDSLAEALVDLVEGLDDWLSKGGFLPEPWAIGRA